MRSVLIGLVFLFPLSSFAQQAPEWDLLPNSPDLGSRVEDLFFLDQHNGWAVIGGNPRIYKTTDGGDTWASMSSPSGYLRSTGFVSPLKGWVGVLDSPVKLYETVDGGSTMTDITSRIQPAISPGICGIWVVDEQVIYAVGQYSGPASLIKTTDGGQSWQSMSLSPHINTAIDVYFFDDQRGLVLGGFGSVSSGNIVPRIIGTEDGGATWTILHTADSIESAWAWKFSFPTPQVGFASIEFHYNIPPPTDGYVLKTTDGGQTWTEMLVPGGGSMQGTGFLTPEIGWTSGRGFTSVTTDGGQTWQQIPLDGGIINRFRFLGDSLGFAGGQRVYRLGPLPVSTEESPDALRSGLESLTPNPAFGPVSIAYRLDQPGTARIIVYDVLGRTVAELDEGVKSAGRHVVVWEPYGERRFRSSGTYLVRLLTENGAWTKVITLVRR